MTSACTPSCSRSGTRSATARWILERGSICGRLITSRMVCLMKSRQAKRKGIGLGQILLYREIFLRRTFVGPDVVSDARMLVSKLW